MQREGPDASVMVEVLTAMYFEACDVVLEQAEKGAKRDAIASAQMSAEDARETAVRCGASALAFVDSPPLETMEDVEDRDEDDAVAGLFRAIDVAMGVDAS
jgi:hypothetical protein